MLADYADDDDDDDDSPPMFGKFTKFGIFLFLGVCARKRHFEDSKALGFLSIEQYFNVRLFSRLTLTLKCEFSLQM